LSFSTLSKQKYVATTVDAWSAAGKSYLGVTCHWIDEETLTRKSCVLACTLMTESHTGEYIAKMLDHIQKKFRIQDSVVRTTTDKGANFVSSFKLFGKQTMRSQVLPDAEDDEIAEEIESMSQQAAPRQDLFVLNVQDAFIGTVNDEPVPIQLHDDLAALAAEDEVNLRYILPKHARCAAHTLNLIASADVTKAKHKFNLNLTQALEKCGALWNQHSTSHHLWNAVKQVRKFFNLIRSQ
jgi:hypothetical protein